MTEELSRPFIKKLGIESFKGIRRAKFDNFGRINVLIGQPNGGKSTILEAMALLKPLQPDQTQFYEVIRQRRGRGRTHEIKDLCYSYSTNPAIFIQMGIFGGGVANLAVKHHRQTRFQFEWKYGGNTVARAETDDKLNIQGAAQTAESNIHGLIPEISLIDQYLLDNLNRTEELLNTLKSKEEEEQEFMEFIKRAFPELENYQFVPRSNSQESPAIFKHVHDKRVHIDYLGDGYKHGIGLLLHLWTTKDKIFLIEEPTAHSYPGALPKIAELIFELAKKNNLQLFIATHNPDFIRHLAQCGRDMVKIYHIEREKDGNVTSREVNWNDIKLMIDIGWDIGNLLRGFQKFVLVEGETDRRVLQTAMKRTAKENMPIDIIYCGGDKKRIRDVAKAILPLGKPVFLCADTDKQSPEETIKSIYQSLKDIFEREGWKVDGRKFTKDELTFDFSSEQIIPVSSSEKGLGNIDDYTEQILLAEPTIMTELGITKETIRECIKNPITASQIVEKANTLPPGLKEIIKKFL